MPTVQPQREALRAAEVERQRQAYFDSLSGGAGGSSNQGTNMADTTTSSQIIRQAPFLEEFQRRLLDQAFLRGETPVDIPDIEVAGLDPLTQQAITAGQGIGQFQDYAASTAFENQQKRQQGISQLLAGVGQVQSQEGIRAGSGIGAFGTQQANLAGIGQGLVGEQTQLLSQLGSVQQTQAQRELDALRQSQLQQSYEPFQRVGFMGDIFKPSIGSAQSTLGVVTAPSPSPLSQAIGVGVGAFGLNRALDNPFGNLFGTGAA